MAAIAPNLTALVGDLVGARLISHAGSLMNLAKHPASTVQILGAEKALFRALKTKHDTPKYGLIYHSSLVGQAPQKLKGKMARMVATKAALSIRLDALADAETKGEEGVPTVGIEARAKLESRLRALEMQSGLSGMRSARNAAGDQGYKQKGFQMEAGGRSYNAAADAAGPSDVAAAAHLAPSMLPSTPSKPSAEDVDEKKLSKEERKALKKARKSEVAAASEPATPAAASDAGELSKEERKALKKAKKEEANGVETPKKDKKDKKKRSADEAEVNGTPKSEPGSSKKKKSKKD